MSPRRRSRFTSWAVGDGDEDSLGPDIDTAGEDVPEPEGEDTEYRGTEYRGTDSRAVVSLSLSDLLVGGNSLSEQTDELAAGGSEVDLDGADGTELPYAGRIVLLPVDAVSPNAVQPRRRFEESSLAALTASVSELGVLQPIIVRPVEDAVVDDQVIDAPETGTRSGSARYELVAGERRWRAARRAGLAHIPALVRNVDDLRSLEEAIVENLHRVDLNPLEEANAFKQLVDDFGLTQEDVAARVGKSRSAVTNTLRLLQLPGSIQRMVMDGELSAGHARTLLSEPNLARQRELAARIIDYDLSVRQAEELARELSGRRGNSQATSVADPSGGRAGASSRAKSAGALEVEGHLADLLDTRVRVTEGTKRGSIVVEFADAEDLDRIYRLFVGPSRRTQAEPSDE